MAKRDFFISYTAQDEAWALWVADTLARHGYSVYIQEWDIPAGEDFISSMNQFLERSKSFIAITSRSYHRSSYCKAEWQAAYRLHQSGEMEQFYPIQVEEHISPPLIATITRINMVGKTDEAEAEKYLLERIGYNGRIHKKGPFPNFVPETELVPEPTRPLFHIPEPVVHDDPSEQKRAIRSLTAIILLVAVLIGVALFEDRIQKRQKEVPVSSSGLIESQTSDHDALPAFETGSEEDPSSVEVLTEEDPTIEEAEEIPQELVKGADDLQKQEVSARAAYAQGRVSASDLSERLTDIAMGTKDDEDRVKALLEDAVALDRTNASAYVALGDWHYDHKHWDKALFYFRRAANLGDAEGMSDVGVYYYYGHGGSGKNYSAAKDYFEKAAELGNVRSYWYLGEIYYEGGYGVERDHEAAWKHYEKAADQGYAQAIRDLGVLCQYGHGVEQDYEKARLYYERASDLGDARAMSNLAQLYQNGFGVEQDHEKARKYYEDAAALGNARAYYNLGIFYEEGTGVELDMDKAIEYYKKSYELGSSAAKDKLSSLGLL